MKQKQWWGRASRTERMQDLLVVCVCRKDALQPEHNKRLREFARSSTLHLPSFVCIAFKKRYKRRSH